MTQPGSPAVLYDSMTRTTSPFVPLIDDVARMYSCGPTVYSRAHLGNMRPYVFADTVKRLLLWKGFEVRHIINITDVGHLLADADLGDDKVEEAAKREQRTVWDLTEHYTRLFIEDVTALACLAPDAWTKATDYVPKMIAFAEQLEAGGHTYVLDSGLYFDTQSIEGYGAMSSLTHDDNTVARIDEVEGKRHPADFALWRTFAPDEPEHAMEWGSPWGRGAPGWHLECSVMSIEALGDHFDIHTGGVDHREVHHPNEDAQSRAFLEDDRPWVERWMHGEFVQFGGEKMAKSKGNVLSLDDVRGAGVDPIAYRLLLLGAHYRSQVRVTIDDIVNAGTSWTRLVEAVRRRLPGHDEVDAGRPLLTVEALATAAEGSARRDYLARLDAAMADDLGTPAALVVVREAVGDAGLADDDLVVVLDAGRAVLGLDLLAAATSAPASAEVDDATRAEIEQLIGDRLAARAAKDFARADAIRADLAERLGVTLADGPDGTSWSIT
jgi:cysteinyl-tRNA synthetase